MGSIHRTGGWRPVACTTSIAGSDLLGSDLAGSGLARGQDEATGEDSAVLDQISVEASSGGTTQGSGSCQAPQATSATGLALSIRETLQSVSVIPSRRIEDQALGTTLDFLSCTTGVNARTAALVAEAVHRLHAAGGLVAVDDRRWLPLVERDLGRRDERRRGDPPLHPAEPCGGRCHGTL